MNYADMEDASLSDFMNRSMARSSAPQRSDSLIMKALRSQVPEIDDYYKKLEEKGQGGQGSSSDMVMSLLGKVLGTNKPGEQTEPVKMTQMAGVTPSLNMQGPSPPPPPAQMLNAPSVMPVTPAPQNLGDLPRQNLGEQIAQITNTGQEGGPAQKQSSWAAANGPQANPAAADERLAEVLQQTQSDDPLQKHDQGMNLDKAMKMCC